MKVLAPLLLALATGSVFAQGCPDPQPPIAEANRLLREMLAADNLPVAKMRADLASDAISKAGFAVMTCGCPPANTSFQNSASWAGNAAGADRMDDFIRTSRKSIAGFNEGLQFVGRCMRGG